MRRDDRSESDSVFRMVGPRSESGWNEVIVVAKKGKPVAVITKPEGEVTSEPQAEDAWERMWQAIDRIRERNADKDSDEELALITEVVEEVRQERYERQKREASERR